MTFSRARLHWLLAACLTGMLLLPCIAMADIPMRVTLPHTQTFTLAGAERDYLIEIAVPNTPPPEAGYPVVYVLDGNAYLPLIRAARDTLRRDDQTAPPLIVAIGYPDTERFDTARRWEDFTPSGVERPDSAPGASRCQGGADRFLAFIDDTLKPWVASHYAIDPQHQALMGHSLGGLFTLHALLSQPEGFSHYIAISPSLWWYGATPLEELAARHHDWRLPEDTHVMLGVGEREQPPAHAILTTERAMRQRAHAMVDNAQGFAAWLDGRSPESVAFTLFANEDHASVMWPAARAGVTFVGKTP